MIEIVDWKTTQKILFFRPFNEGEPWTKERDEELIELVDRGYTREEASYKIGRSSEAVKTRAVHLCLRFSRDSYGGSYKPEHDRPQYEKRKDQEARDIKFLRALAVAIYRGDHLPGASNVG